ncbi:MAG: MBL fold metallo-hydrolase [Defluviitaleaceae bacterium]|nr:MBL fold metallo-hydrolase [Defluviitaleaceae bacterium]
MENYYTVLQLKENVYRIFSPENTYCELLIGTEKALLIDTGYGFGDLKRVVKAHTGNKPLIIVNTHGHYDHTCGNGQFDEDIYIGKDDIVLCGKHTSEKARRNAIKNAEALNRLPENFNEETYLVQGSGNLVPFHDGHIFNLGGITMRAISAPGHSAGSMCLLYEEENWLYTGDAANAMCWLFLREFCGKDVYLNTLDKLEELNPIKIFSAHRPNPSNANVLQLYKRAAMEADFSKGFPFESPFASGDEVRVCPIDGLTPDDIDNPAFAAVIICETFS